MDHFGHAAGRTAGALALCAMLAGCGLSGPATPSELVAFDEASAISAVNAFRAEQGLPPVRANPLLTQAAKKQSEAMVASGEMSHSVDGPLPRRVESFGYSWSATAENLGRGYLSYGDALTGWVNSPGHRKNLLNTRVTEVGVAGAKPQGPGPNYWTMILAAPR